MSDEEYYTHELPHASQQLRIKQNRRRNCLAWTLVVILALLLFVGAASITWVLLVWK